MATEAMTQ